MKREGKRIGDLSEMTPEWVKANVKDPECQDFFLNYLEAEIILSVGKTSNFQQDRGGIRSATPSSPLYLQS